MYIVDGIAYAGEQKPALKVSGVRPLSNYRLWVQFNTGEAKLFDCNALLKETAFQPLADRDVFSNVYIDYGVLVWNDGEIDIAPEFIYENGTNTNETESA